MTSSPSREASLLAKLASVPELPPVLVDAFQQCRRHFMAAAVFSLLINVLYLAPTLYMLQVYDRIVPTGGKLTLLFITLALAFALLALSSLDMVRNRLLVRASQRLDALLAPLLLRQMIATDSAVAGQAMRDFDSIRNTMATPVIAAMFDAPWTPVFLLVAFLLHFWIGMLAVVAAASLLTIAWLNQRATKTRMEIATSAMAAAHNSQHAAAAHGTTVKALGNATNTAESVDAAKITAVLRTGGPLSLGERMELVQAVEAVRSDGRRMLSGISWSMRVMPDLHGTVDPVRLNGLMAAARLHYGSCVRKLPADWPTTLLRRWPSGQAPGLKVTHSATPVGASHDADDAAVTSKSDTE